jgi:hypothetical protein
MVTSGKTSMARLDTDFQKMDYDKLRKSLNGFARMCYRVPPEIVGDIELEQGDGVRRTREPGRAVHSFRAPSSCGASTRSVSCRVSVGRATCSTSNPVPADSEFTLRVMGTFPSSFTGNEARALAGKKPRPDMDEPLEAAARAGS